MALPVIPAIALAFAIAIGVILYAGLSVVEVQELQEAASQNTQERLQEVMFGEYEGVATSPDQAVIVSDWVDNTRVVALVVTCQDGTVHTSNMNITIDGGGVHTFNSTELSILGGLAAKCPP